MSLFKRAAVRGIAHELIRNGVCEFPTKEAADEAADAVADGPMMQHAPEVSPEQGHSPEEVAAIANKLIEIAHALMAEAGAGGPPPGAGAPPGAPGAGGPPSGEVAAMKQAAERDLDVCASEAAVAVMEKAAAEVKTAGPKGALMHGGDAQNTPADAAKHDSVAALDQKQRPQGKYQVARGDTALKTEGGAIGELKSNPEKPHNSPSGTNSVSKGSKSAQLDEELNKIANKLIGLHKSKDGNKGSKAVTNDSVVKLDEKQRPKGYAVVGQGNANFKEPQAARVGTEQPHPSAPSNSPGGTNSVIEASKAAELNDEEQAFLTLFSKCAEDVGQYLPEALTQEQKVAEIRSMMILDHDGRQARILELHKTAEAKPEETKEACECKGDAKCEKHKTEKKSALLERVTEIATKATAKS